MDLEHHQKIIMKMKIILAKNMEKMNLIMMIMNHHLFWVKEKLMEIAVVIKILSIHKELKKSSYLLIKMLLLDQNLKSVKKSQKIK